MNDDMKARDNLENLLNDLRGYTSALAALSDVSQQCKDFEMYSDGLQFTSCKLIDISNKLDALYENIDCINIKKPSIE